MQTAQFSGFITKVTVDAPVRNVGSGLIPGADFGALVNKLAAKTTVGPEVSGTSLEEIAVWSDSPHRFTDPVGSDSGPTITTVPLTPVESPVPSIALQISTSEPTIVPTTDVIADSTPITRIEAKPLETSVAFERTAIPVISESMQSFVSTGPNSVGRTNISTGPGSGAVEKTNPESSMLSPLQARPEPADVRKLVIASASKELNFVASAPALADADSALIPFGAASPEPSFGAAEVKLAAGPADSQPNGTMRSSQTVLFAGNDPSGFAHFDPVRIATAKPVAPAAVLVPGATTEMTENGTARIKLVNLIQQGPVVDLPATPKTQAEDETFIPPRANPSPTVLGPGNESLGKSQNIALAEPKVQTHLPEAKAQASNASFEDAATTVLRDSPMTVPLKQAPRPTASQTAIETLPGTTDAAFPDRHLATAIPNGSSRNPLLKAVSPTSFPIEVRLQSQSKLLEVFQPQAPSGSVLSKEVRPTSSTEPSPARSDFLPKLLAPAPPSSQQPALAGETVILAQNDLKMTTTMPHVSRPKAAGEEPLQTVERQARPVVPARNDSIVQQSAPLNSAADVVSPLRAEAMPFEDGEAPVTELLAESSRHDPLRETPRIANDPKIPRHIAEQLTSAVRHSSGGPVEIALNPEELGRVRMTLQANDGAIVVALTIERPETADLMRRHLVLLGAEFKELGYSDVSFSFSGEGAGQESSGEHQADTAPATDALSGEAPDMVTGQRPTTTQKAGLDLRL